ncbi:hypothetical protein M427DRAFT_33302 [Gonapodya prolifera JEL478]|uniref:Uncharacterized protein n=1 Tax=Gonapodya prolifera (strain JEL478) TaxID=1344416 RepID=A0A139ABG2_GONPJ|nr:hypothetical protein M427DRAFT_33302 [Gonapodya prolifera JEL478]|eukprot:KXS14087.1 hypothetical protein M427DRAFT_33302 [Gonapodya prolifera JEL478]
MSSFPREGGERNPNVDYRREAAQFIAGNPYKRPIYLTSLRSAPAKRCINVILGTTVWNFMLPLQLNSESRLSRFFRIAIFTMAACNSTYARQPAEDPSLDALYSDIMANNQQTTRTEIITSFNLTVKVLAFIFVEHQRSLESPELAAGKVISQWSNEDKDGYWDLLDTEKTTELNLVGKDPTTL